MSETRRGSGSGKSHLEGKCQDCGKSVQDKDKGLQCEVCDFWFHAKCQNISEEAYKLLIDNEAMHWYCSSCNRSVVNILKTLAGIKSWQEKTDQELLAVKKELASVKAELKAVGLVARSAETMVKATDTLAKATEVKLETVVESCLVEGIDKSVESKVNDKVKVVKEDVAEAMEIERRKNNIVFHGIKDWKEAVVSLDELGSRDLQRSPDQEVVEEILKAGLHLDATRHIVEVQRIGRYVEGKSRPLRVRVKTVEAKNEVLKRARDLKNVEEFKHIFIAPDLTRRQQAVDKELRDKVKQFRSEGQNNVKIKHGKVIKNEPGKEVVVLYQPL